MTALLTELTTTALRRATRHRRVRLLITSIMPSPYQRELFDAMASHPDMSIRVCYYTPDAPDRQWDRAALPAHSQVLPGIAFHSLVRCCSVNPSIIPIIQRERFDLAIIGDYFTPTSQLAMRLLHWQGVPWMLWGEAPGVADHGRLGARLRRWAQRPLRRSAAGIAAIGSKAVRAYRQIVGPDVPVFNIPYHGDLTRYLQIKRDERNTDGGVRFLYSGQCIHRKGVDVLLRAFTQVAQQDARCTLTVLGDGPDRPALQRTVPANLRDRVRFAGFAQPAELPNHFADADVFVLPSRYDGWGVVVNEAVGAGMPVIASDAVGAAHDLVEPDRNGYIVPTGQVAPLTAAMRTFVRFPNQITTFGTRSRDIARNWTVERGAERWYSAACTVLDRIERQART